MRLCLLVAVLTPCFAADVYSGASATGGGTGADWNNQVDFDSVTMVRGNVYYLADGAYSRTSFATAASGTTLITVRKATASSHGTETGWSSTYGDGQATFGSITVTTPYWLITGVEGGGPSAWESGHGIKITGYDAAPLTDENNDNVTLEHIEIDVGSVGPEDVNAVVIDYQNSVTIRYAWIHDIGCDVFKMRYGGDDFTLEYSKVARSYQDAGCHGDLFEAQAATFNRWIIRWNYFEDIVGSYLFGAHDGATVAGYEIYGNILHFKNKGASTGNGTVGTLTAGGTITGLKFYNNSISGIFDSTIGVAQNGSGSISGEARNNIWHEGTDNTYSFGYSSSTHNNNTHYNMPTQIGEENLTGNPFTGVAGGDFTLTAATTAGASLSSPYDTDMLGTTRGADGTWDRGAFEYNAGGGGGSTTSSRAGGMARRGGTGR